MRAGREARSGGAGRAEIALGGGAASRGSARAIDAPSWRSRTPAASSAPSPPGRAWRRRFPEAPPSCAVSRARGCAATSRCFQRVVRSAAGSSSGRGRSLPAETLRGPRSLDTLSRQRPTSRGSVRRARGPRRCGARDDLHRAGVRARGRGDDVHALARGRSRARRARASRLGRPPPAPPESWWSRVRRVRTRLPARSREPRRGRGAGEGGRVSREARPGRLLPAGAPPRVPVLPLVARRAPLG